MSVKEVIIAHLKFDGELKKLFDNWKKGEHVCESKIERRTQRNLSYSRQSGEHDKANNKNTGEGGNQSSYACGGLR